MRKRHVGSEISFFFFKQKTAYEMLRSLVGSDMCIRDRSGIGVWPGLPVDNSVGCFRMIALSGEILRTFVPC